MYKLKRFNRSKDLLKYFMPFGKILEIVHDEENGKYFTVVVNKDGSLQTTFSYRGPDLDSTIKETLAIMTSQLNRAFSAIDTGYVLYFEAQRVSSHDYARDTFFPDPLTAAIDWERRKMFSDGSHYESNYYTTIWWMPPNDSEQKMKEFVIEGRKHKEILIENIVNTFAEQTDKILAMFQSLKIPCQYLSGDETLSYLYSTVSDEARPLRLPEREMLLDQYLYSSPLYGGLEPRLGHKHLRVITPIGFLNETIFGMFNQLNRLDFPYRWVCRYYCLSKQDAIGELEGVKRGWNGKIRSLTSTIKEIFFNKVSDGDINQNALLKFDEAKDAINAVEMDTTNYGYFSTAIIVMDEDLEKVETKARFVRQTLINLGLKAKIEDLNAIDAWMGSIPGNVGHFNRRPMISAGNLVHLMPICDVWAGPIRNDALRAPVLMYTSTAGNTPFRLNLHIGSVGHTMIVGPTGAGKSVHLNLIAAQFRKYKDAHVFIFDKGLSSRVLTEGVGGTFYNLGSEESNLSFQPLANIDNQKELQWASGWLCDFAAQENVTITPTIKNFILDSLAQVAAAPKELRTLSTFVFNLQDQLLKETFRPLTINGPFGSIFDSNKDNLSFGSWQSFEMEKLMETKEIVGPTLMYIFHRIEQQLNGQPTIISLDECWVFFDNDLFVTKIREWLKTLRKANASVIFATQSLNDIVKSPIFPVVLESCFSRIFLPNPEALEKSMREMYKAFGLNERQLQIIASAIPQQHYYYVSPLGNRLYSLSLRACPLTLAFIATNKADSMRCGELIEEYGKEQFLQRWLEYRGIEWPEMQEESQMVF